MNKFQPQIRLIVSCAMGAFFVIESFNPDFWRPHLESLATVVHLFIGLFGLAWLIQAVFIFRQLRTEQN